MAVKQAKPLHNMIPVLWVDTLPNLVKVAHVRCLDHKDLESLPNAIEYEGVVYGRSGWNSDILIAYYRTDYRNLAFRGDALSG